MRVTQPTLLEALRRHFVSGRPVELSAAACDRLREPWPTTGRIVEFFFREDIAPTIVVECDWQEKTPRRHQVAIDQVRLLPYYKGVSPADPEPHQRPRHSGRRLAH